MIQTARKWYFFVKRLCRNIVLDLRYGRTFLGGSVYTKHGSVAASMVISTDYAIMPLLFEGRLSRDMVLVDVGCGKGRVLNWWLSRGLGKTIIGVELDEDVAAKIRHRLRRYQRVQIRTGSILEVLPPDAEVFFLFNPFKRPIMEQFKDRVAAAYRARGVTIIYYAPVHLDVFKADPLWEVEEFTIEHTEFLSLHPIDRHRQYAVCRFSPCLAVPAEH